MGQCYLSCTGVIAVLVNFGIFQKRLRGWFALGLTGLVPCCQRDSWKPSPALLSKSINSLVFSLLYSPYMIPGKIIAWTIWTFVCKAMSLLFNILSRFVIAFLLRSKSLLISWPQSLLPMILEPKKIKSVILEHEKRNLRHGLIINSAAIHYEALWYRVLHVKNNCIINSNITEGNSLVSWVLVSYIYRHCPNPVGIFDKQKLSDKQCYWGPVPFQHQPHTSHIIRTDDRNNLSQHHCRSSKGNITLWY